MSYQRSRRLDNDSEDSKELLVSPSPPGERETMKDDIVEPTDLVDPMIPDPIPRYIAVMGHKRLPASARQTLQDAEGHVAPHQFWERKRPHRYVCYVALMGSLLNLEPTTYEEASKH